MHPQGQGVGLSVYVADENTCRVSLSSVFISVIGSACHLAGTRAPGGAGTAVWLPEASGRGTQALVWGGRAGIHHSSLQLYQLHEQLETGCSAAFPTAPRKEHK